MNNPKNMGCKENQDKPMGFHAGETYNIQYTPAWALLPTLIAIL